MKHRTTDPACVQHRPPTGWWSRWRFNRGRGRSCKRCRLAREFLAWRSQFDSPADRRLAP